MEDRTTELAEILLWSEGFLQYRIWLEFTLLKLQCISMYNAISGQKSSFWEVIVQIVLKRIQYLTHA